MKELAIVMFAALWCLAEAGPPPEEGEFLKSSPNRVLFEEKREDKVDGSAQIKWGEGHGIEWESQLKKKTRDSQGRYREATLTRKSDGSTTTEVQEGQDNLKEKRTKK